MTHATERDWIAATSGNAAPDREDFEQWALSYRGAPRRSDPHVWEYLITLAEEMEAAERGAYGQMHDELADSIAHGVVMQFRQATPNARRRRTTTAPAFRSMLKPNPLPAAARRAQRKRMVQPGDVVTVDMRGLAHNLPPRVDMMVLERIADTFTGRIVDKSNFAQRIPYYQPPVPFLGTVFHDIPTSRVIEAFTPSPEDVDFYLRHYGAERELTANRQPPPPPSALRSARERDRARYGEDEEIPTRPFDPEERMPLGTKPHHFAYPNARRNPEPAPRALPPMRPLLPPKR